MNQLWPRGGERSVYGRRNIICKNLVCMGEGDLGTFKDIDFEESGGRRGRGWKVEQGPDCEDHPGRGE